ncbi:hypothetical protein [Marivita geojedonensis]|uniref:Uncharacterized protein n=1 Tax=Marivita geojedonensis TaxID=1123756 RepID=A0A1X4NHT6_9RHOB|nr:hypothetical protein [Marivita geojedonensis]OSQ47291.1 hypothetical protein MGEO_16195 [Marivita geojedonensis]PRY76461.1 hypothetical protein CLV76_11181 [Marivita geojedonensis]
MARRPAKPVNVNVVIVGQMGRLAYEALLFALSMRANTPDPRFRLYVAEPQPGPNWQTDPTIRPDPLRSLIEAQGATILPFENRHFGSEYPYGNKIEALFALPKGEPFVFFDTDTLITGDLGEVPFDFNRPGASLRVEGTWPQIELYGPGYTEIWKSLYDRFDLDFKSSLDLSQPDEYWRRYLYFNAGYFFYSCPHVFGQTYLDFALSIQKDPPKELVCQPLKPWLDQIALPLVIHKLGGGRDALPEGYLDGKTSVHYRNMPLLYARESDAVIDLLEDISAPNPVKKLMKEYEPFKRMIYQNRGHKVRALFDQDHLPQKEQPIRQRIKKNGFWMV